MTSKPAGLENFDGPVDFIIWTTTPWTIPSDQAVSLKPGAAYVAVEHDGRAEVMLEDLAPKCCEEFGWEYTPVMVAGKPYVVPAETFHHIHYKQPIFDGVEGVALLADYVGVDDGTGIVHNSPGHGVDDYFACLKEGITDICMPVDDDGKFYTGEEFGTGGPFSGMDTDEANPHIIEFLRERGTLVLEKKITHSYPHCWRCKHPVLFRATDQWFVSMDKTGLREQAGKEVRENVKWYPAHAANRIGAMVEQRPDWCISRQRNWGVPIPSYTCADCGEKVMNDATLDAVIKLFHEKGSDAWFTDAPESYLGEACVCPKCGGHHVHQDENVLDTWFSSALWPFSTLGWPNEDSEDLKYFYPTNTLVTGYDIIGFWVSRMIFSGLAYTGKAPFDTVCIHGIVRDSQGRKMSKSLGNGIDPLEVIAQYGADALRFMLVDGSTPGNDMRYIEKKVEAARNFANKLWNATRFVLMNLPEDFEPGLPCEELLDMSDKWVLTKLNQVAGAMTDNLEHYEMGLAAAKINSFIWDVYCDWFIEIAKPRLNSGDAEQADTARRVLVYVLDKALKLLHPFMPFITEELYQALPGSAETIMTQSWPTFDEAHNWAEEEEAFEKVMDYIKAVRTMRTEMNVHPAKKTSMIIETADPAPFQNAEVYLAKFAFATDVTFTEKYEGSTDGMVQVSTHTARGFIPMMELIDREKELARLNKEKAKAEKELAMFENQLANPKFVERAPAALVEEIRAKRTNSQSKLANIEQSIKALG